MNAADVSRVIHGTTVATNCILTQSGARLGLLMTEGLRDVLYIGVGWRPRMYEIDMDPVEPLFLAPRRRSLGVRERMGAHGEVVTPLDEAHLAAVAKTLVEEHDVQVFVVCFLHSYTNPAHERRAREVLASLYPKIPVTLSSDVLPRKREYRRLVAAGFDGYVKPIVTNYLTGLQGSMAAAGIDAPLHIMLSHGGVAGIDNVVERPVRTVLSGLAAGVIGAAHVGAVAGCPDCISLDMGGTSTDVALIRGGHALVTSDGKFEDYPLNLTMVDVRTIGAGGSSKASVDAAGGLKVGPESAGAFPGPGLLRPRRHDADSHRRELRARLHDAADLRRRHRHRRCARARRDRGADCQTARYQRPRSSARHPCHRQLEHGADAAPGIDQAWP